MVRERAKQRFAEPEPGMLAHGSAPARDWSADKWKYLEKGYVGELLRIFSAQSF